MNENTETETPTHSSWMPTMKSILEGFEQDMLTLGSVIIMIKFFPPIEELSWLQIIVALTALAIISSIAGAIAKELKE